MKIGELAARTGVGIHAIRFYERRGLLKSPPRRTSGYRDYAPEAEATLRFIKQAQSLGYALNEIKDLLQLRAQPAANVAQVRASTTAKLHSLDEKILALQRMRADLERLIADCNCGTAGQPTCMLFDVSPNLRSKS
jgi:MerR family transcriptional regulator, copper efflux regulator